MKIKTEEVLLNELGDSLKNDGKDYKLKDMLAQATLANLEGDKDDKKSSDFSLFFKVKNNIDENGDLDLSSEEVTRLKEKIRKISPTIIVGQVCDFLLEGEKNPLK